MFDTFISTKTGEIYSYSTENEMLRVAKILDEEGYELRLYREFSSKFPFKINVIGYKLNSKDWSG